jgi:glycosyltransferase involved in cell wall biosynthesis
MERMPLVSVIMNCYNGQQFLKEAIQSVLNQTYPRLEIIFWDNASTDRSVQIVNEFGDSRINLFENTKNVPLGLARNYALSKATGDYVSFLDVDDIWETTCLEEMQKEIQNKPTVGLVFSDSNHFNTIGIIKTTSSNIACDLSSIDLSKGKVKKALLTYGCFVDIEAVLIKSEYLHQLKINSKLTFAEDYDLWLKLGELCSFVYINKPLANWRVHDKQATQIYKQIVYREELYLYFKYLRKMDILFNSALLKRVLIRVYKFITLSSKEQRLNDLISLLSGFKEFKEYEK